MHCKGACMKPLLDVLMILDALEKEGSFAAASAKLYKTVRSELHRSQVGKRP